MNKERNSEKYFNLKKQFLYFYPARKKSSPPNLGRIMMEKKKRKPLYIYWARDITRMGMKIE
jgi:hypothetical protein